MLCIREIILMCLLVASDFRIGVTLVPPSGCSQTQTHLHWISSLLCMYRCIPSVVFCASMSYTYQDYRILRLCVFSLHPFLPGLSPVALLLPTQLSPLTFHYPPPLPLLLACSPASVPIRSPPFPAVMKLCVFSNSRAPPLAFRPSHLVSTQLFALSTSLLVRLPVLQPPIISISVGNLAQTSLLSLALCTALSDVTCFPCQEADAIGANTGGIRQKAIRV